MTNIRNFIIRYFNYSGEGEPYCYITFPIKKAKANTFVCKWGFVGVSKPMEGEMIGADRMDAILLAIKMISIVVYSSNEYMDGKLTWSFGERIDDMGFFCFNRD